MTTASTSRALAALALSFAATGALAQTAFTCPRQGGELIVGLEAGVPTLDQPTGTSTPTRNVAMNIFETLVIRDENMNPVPDLAESIETSPDGLTYTFRLRPGVKFHNGKPLTSADVAASFDRYKAVGVNRAILNVVSRWSARDDLTFVIELQRPQPTFLEALSGYTVPVVIVPSEEAAKPAGQLSPVGTGPFRFVEFVPDGFVKLRRYEDYVPNKRLSGMSGFAGQKQACVDSVTFRIMKEAGARVAALETGEIHIAENVPTASQQRLRGKDGIALARLETFAINASYPNWSAPPTNNLKVRQAMAAALNMEDIMSAATDGAFKLNPSLQYPGQAYHSDAGKEFYDQRNTAKAKELLREAGYRNEPVVLLTNQQFPNMYNAALVMHEQLRAAGINSELKVLDWPTALAISEKEVSGWNVFFTHWSSVVAQGGAATLRNLANPNNVYKPANNQGDPEFNAAFAQVENGATIEERREAFARAQKIAFEKVLAIPFGAMPTTLGVRSRVKNFVPFHNIRVANVWLEN